MTGVLIRKKKSGHREEMHMTMEAETRAMLPQAKELQGLQATTRITRKAWQRFPSTPLRSRINQILPAH